jgi:hypothetical protein
MAPSTGDTLTAILLELREQRAAIEDLARASWLAYAQEIGRSTLPGGVRLDVILVLGAAGATGLLGIQGDAVARALGALVGPVTP